MKNYDPNIRFSAQRVRVTLQCWDHVGSAILTVHGNCKGLSILDSCDFESETYENAEFENESYWKYHEDCDCFYYSLVKDGDVLTGTANAEEMNDMIVSIEIIDIAEETEF